MTDRILLTLCVLVGALAMALFSMYAISHIPYHKIGSNVYKCERIDQ
jgi:hypothetical protein